MFYFCKQVSQSENCGGDTGEEEEEEDEKRREMKYMLPGGRKTAGEVSFMSSHFTECYIYIYFGVTIFIIYSEKEYNPYL